VKDETTATKRALDPERDRDELEQERQFLREYRDWAINAIHRMPAPRPGSGVNLNAIRERLQAAADAASENAEWADDTLNRMPKFKPRGVHERPDSLRYVNMSLIEAIEMFLEQNGAPQPEERVISELVDGGAVLGRKRHVGEIKKSLEMNARTGRLKLVKERYGLSGWGSEKWK
jgi:hypothetical protein